MTRTVAWQRAPSDTVSWRQDQALNATIYILRELGPTSFLLKEDGQAKKFKVLLGDPHLCDCSDFKKEKLPCKHICWLLLKKFKLHRQNELSYQLGLVEREINEVLRNPTKSQLVQEVAKEEQQMVDCQGRKELEQRPLSEEDVCPICQETLLTKRQPVTYCRYGCGNSVHIKCMKVWVDHQRHSSSSDVIMCPFCRGEFASPKLLALEFRNTWHERKMTSDKLDVHSGVGCNCCKMNPIKGKCYRCDTCENLYLCNTCFHNKQHAHHSFVFRLKKTQRWRSAPSRDHNAQGQILLSPIINELQTREITENDYDVLLRLDRPSENSISVPVDLAGLPDHVINRIPMSKVKEGGRLLAPGRQCRLCLHSYSAGQLVRRLPECGHVFHRHCIDAWLSQDHRCCPIDRTMVVIPKTKAKDVSSNRLAQFGNGEAKKDEGEMVVPGVGLIHFSPGAAASVRRTSPAKHRMKPILVKHSSPVNVTMSDLLVQADAICVGRGTSRQFLSQPVEPPPPATSPVANALSFDSILPKIEERQQKKTEGKDEVMRRARLKKFSKHSDGDPSSVFFGLKLNGTQCPASTVKGQNSFVVQKSRPAGDTMRAVLRHHIPGELAKTKVHRGLAIAKKTATSSERRLFKHNQDKDIDLEKDITRETSFGSIARTQLRNPVGSHSAPPFLVSKHNL